MARAKPKAALPPWSKWNWGDYAKHTSFLDGELHSAYLNLLRVYLAECGPLPDDEDEIFFRAGIKTDAMKDNTRAVLRVLFWRGEDGRLHNDFADDLIGIGTKYSEEQSQRAKLGMEGRERDERGRIGPKVPRNHPAVAGSSPAVGGNDPAVAGNQPAVAGPGPADAGEHPAILEPRTRSKSQIKGPDLYKNTTTPESSFRGGSGNVDVPKNQSSLISSSKEDVPAPPKGKGAEAGSRVGADIYIPQLTAKGPSVCSAPADKSPPPADQPFIGDGLAKNLVVQDTCERLVTTKFGDRTTYRFKAEGEWFNSGFKDPQLHVGDVVTFDFTKSTFGKNVGRMLSVSKAAP